MTNAGPIILILVSVAIGYVIEPIIIADKKKSAPEKKEDKTEAKAPENVVPSDSPEPEVQVDLSKITPEDFPEKVTLKVPYTISDASSGVTMNLKAGSKVKPIRLDGSQLIIQPVGLPVESKIHVSQTNFANLAAPKMIARLKNQVAKNATTPTPAPTPTPEPKPEPKPEPTPEPVVQKLDEGAIVKLMKDSVAAGKVTEFQATQVTKWKAGKDTEFDGQKYQTGIVTFKAETILGVQEHDAIALIGDDGKVHKWMWAKTKLEMR